MADKTIHVTYGTDARAMAWQLLEAAMPEEDLQSDARILVKPNLVVARPSTHGATTTPGFAQGVIEYFQSKGFHNLSITEGSWLGCETYSAFRICGYEDLAQRMGVDLVDTKSQPSTQKQAGSLSMRVCDCALQADLIVNLPVLKGHCQTGMTCALKNMKGLIPDSEKRRFHTLGLHRPIAALNAILPRQFILVDALNGDLDYEEGGNPVEMNMAFACDDPVLCDAYAARWLGFALSDVPYITMAEDLNVGSTDLDAAQITELVHAAQHTSPARRGKVAQLARHIADDQSCSACYGSLIHALARLDEQGLLRNLPGKVHVGQGWRGKDIQGIGIGECTRGASCHLKGCPSQAGDILEFLLQSM